jgi:hypothetical protein
VYPPNTQTITNMMPIIARTAPTYPSFPIAAVSRDDDGDPDSLY